MYDGGDWGALELPGDPVRGDPANVRALATFSQRETGYWQEHAESLRTTATYGNSMPMEGDFAPRYREHLGELPVQAGALRDAHEQAGQALGRYSEQLEQAKAQSRQALSQGVQAKQQHQQAMRAYNQARAQQNSLPKTVYSPAEYEWVMAQWEALEAQAERAWMAAEQAEQQRLAARQRAVQAGEQATQAEASCAQRVRAAVLDGKPPSKSSGSAPGGAAVLNAGSPVPMDLMQALHKANPNFVSSDDSFFGSNCNHGVQAYELRRRGIDVEATELPMSMHAQGGRPASDIEDVWGRKFTYGSKADIEKALSQNGSRGVVYLHWKTGAAHVFSAENVNGRVRYLDPQNRVLDVDHYFAHAYDHTFRLRGPAFVRLDDLPLPNLDRLRDVVRPPLF